jgi:hypothetical protein
MFLLTDWFNIYSNFIQYFTFIKCKAGKQIVINIQDMSGFFHTLDARIEGTIIEYTPTNTMV